jgi:translation initiation factor IF-3
LRINNEIRVLEVLLISSTGEKMGVVNTRQALMMARNEQLDLVEVSANSTPPVCKIIDYGKYQYEQSKKEKQNSKPQTKVKNKEVKVRPNIDTHDLNVKIKQARTFLEKGFRVRLSCFFRGREMMHKDQGVGVLKKMIEELSDCSTTDAQPKMAGRICAVNLSPAKAK